MRRLAVLLCLTAACVGDRPQGVMVVAVPGEPATLFPPHVRSASEIAVATQIFLKLADVGASLNTVGDSGFVPMLASAWRFRDSVHLAFDLDPDARWHDGMPVTAHDVAFTFSVYRDTLVNAAGAPLLSGIATLEAEGDRTVVMRFIRAYPAQFYDAVHHMRILPSHVLDTIPRDRLRGHALTVDPVGSGPYRVARRLPGELLELEAVPDWWGESAGAERIVFRVTPDLQTAIGQLVAGEADVVEALPTPDDVTRVRASGVARAEEFPSSVYMYLGFNVSVAPFTDPAVRRALVQAVDRGAIIGAVLGGRGVVPPGPVTPVQWIADGAPEQAGYDPAAARAVLAGRGIAFDIMYPSTSGIREATAVILERQFREVGVAVRLVPLDPNTMDERALQGRFDALINAWQVDLLPDAIRELWGSSGIGGANYGRYASPRFDSLVLAASSTRDPAAARPIWHDALAQINDDAPAIWLFSPQLAVGVSNRVENVTIMPDNWAATLRLWRLVQ